jgi:formylglycine-generating enzyme required for sulfatase activity
MKTTTNFLLSLLLAGAAGVTGAYAQKPQLAVLVVGMESDAKCDELAARWAYDLNRDGAYELLTKGTSGSVKLKFDELSKQLEQGKSVDTTGIAKWGREKGIALVQLVVQDTIGISPIENITKRVAWLVDCSTGKLSGRGTFRLRFPSPPYLEDKVNRISLVGVRGGTFEMGCKAGRDDKVAVCNADEEPLHWVKVNDFKIGKYEITQGVWKAVMGSLPDEIIGDYLGDDKPVVFVSPDTIVGVGGFLERLNALTGKSFRLPTEAEWEYAARGCEAGSCENFEFSGSDNVAEMGWYSDNYPSDNAQPVGGRLPNALGIYDMSGNAYEWCFDWYSDTYYPSNTTQSSPQDNPTGPDAGANPNRVLRGGAWYYGAERLRAAGRYARPSDYRSRGHGFRVVLP